MSIRQIVRTFHSNLTTDLVALDDCVDVLTWQELPNVEVWISRHPSINCLVFTAGQLRRHQPGEVTACAATAYEATAVRVNRLVDFPAASHRRFGYFAALLACRAGPLG